MSRRVHLRPEALREIEDSAGWYAERGPALATAFLDEVSRVVGVIASNPQRYSFAEEPIRKAVLHRFPYVILFRATGDDVVVLSCFHTRRDPQDLEDRS